MRRICALLTAVARVWPRRRWALRRTAARAIPLPSKLAVSPTAARLYVVCEGTDEVVVLDSHAGTIVRRDPGRPPAQRASRSPQMASALYVANSWSDSVSEIDTASLAGHPDLPAGFEPNAVIPGPRRAASSTWPTASATTFPWSTWRPARRSSGSRRPRRQLPGAFAGRRTASIAPTSTRPRRVPHAARIRNHCHRHRAADGGGPLSTSQCGRECSTWRCRPTAAWEWPPQLRPKNLIPLAHVEHGWVFGNSIRSSARMSAESCRSRSTNWTATSLRPSASPLRRTKAPPTFRPPVRTA